MVVTTRSGLRWHILMLLGVIDHLLFILLLYICLATGFLLLLMTTGSGCISVDHEVLLMACHTGSAAQRALLLLLMVVVLLLLLLAIEPGVDHGLLFRC